MNVIGIVVGVFLLGVAAWSLATGQVPYRINPGRPMRVHTRQENPLAYWGLLLIFTVLGFVILITSIAR